MTIKRFQNTIAQSRFSLLMTSSLAVVVCALLMLTIGVNTLSFIQMVCVAISTFLMVKLNNDNALLRTYSRMVSCTFLVFCLIALPFIVQSYVGVVLLCFVAFYTFLFMSYQNHQSQGLVFFAFTFLGIASIFFIQILFFVPIFWLLMRFKIMSMSIRTFCASLIGLITPYWFASGYYVYTNETDRLINHFTSIATFTQLTDYSAITLSQFITFIFLFIVALIGTIHFLCTSYMDKIKTRMFYELFIIVNIAIVVFMALQPTNFSMLLMLFIVNVSPIVAHYITFTHTRFTNISVQIIMFLSLALVVYNIWIG